MRFNDGAAWQYAMTGYPLNGAARIAAALAAGENLSDPKHFADVYANPSPVRCGRRHPRRRPWWSWLGSHRVGYRRCACGRRWAWDAGQWVAYGDPEPGGTPGWLLEDLSVSSDSTVFRSPVPASPGTILSDAACYCPAGPLDCAGCDE